MTTPFPVEVMRVYEDWQNRPGTHLFVDRLWPRGVAKEDFQPDEWLKEIAPSSELRKWYHGDTQGRWQEFQDRYRAELDSNPESVAHVLELCRKGPVTLLTSTRDVSHSATVVLRDALIARLEDESR